MRKKKPVIPNSRRVISYKAVMYLQESVLNRGQLRDIARLAGVTPQRVHQQLCKFPAALRTDAAMCARFVAWFDAQCVNSMAWFDVVAWVEQNAPQPAPVESITDFLAGEYAAPHGD